MEQGKQGEHKYGLGRAGGVMEPRELSKQVEQREQGAQSARGAGGAYVGTGGWRAGIPGEQGV